MSKLDKLVEKYSPKTTKTDSQAQTEPKKSRLDALVQKYSTENILAKREAQRIEARHEGDMARLYRSEKQIAEMEGNAMPQTTAPAVSPTAAARADALRTKLTDAAKNIGEGILNAGKGADVPTAAKPVTSGSSNTTSNADISGYQALRGVGADGEYGSGLKLVLNRDGNDAALQTIYNHLYAGRITAEEANRLTSEFKIVVPGTNEIADFTELGKMLAEAKTKAQQISAADSKLTMQENRMHRETGDEVYTPETVAKNKKHATQYINEMNPEWQTDILWQTVFGEDDFANVGNFDYKTWDVYKNLPETYSGENDNVITKEKVAQWEAQGYSDVEIANHLRLYAENAADEQNTIGDVLLHKHLSDDEKYMFVYIWQTEGRDKAEQYLNSLRDVTANREASLVYSDLDGSWFKKRGYQFLYGLGKGLQGFEAMGYNSELKGSASVDDFVSEKISESELKDGKKTLNNYLDSLLISTGQMTPSMAAGIMPGVGPIARFLTTVGTSGGNAMIDARREGKSYDESLVFGLAKGVSEAGLETVLGSIGKGTFGLAGKAGGKAAQTATKAFASAHPKITKLLTAIGEHGGRLAGDFTDEYMQEILDPVIRNIVFDENNEVKLFTSEALEAGILGAVMSGVYDGITSAIDITTGKIDDAKAIKALTEAGHTKAEAKAILDAYKSLINDSSYHEQIPEFMKDKYGTNEVDVAAEAAKETVAEMPEISGEVNTEAESEKTPAVQTPAVETPAVEVQNGEPYTESDITALIEEAYAGAEVDFESEHSDFDDKTTASEIMHKAYWGEKLSNSDVKAIAADGRLAKIFNTAFGTEIDFSAKGARSAANKAIESGKMAVKAKSGGTADVTGINNENIHDSGGVVSTTTESHHSIRESLSEDAKAAFDIAMDGASDKESAARQFEIKYREGELGYAFEVDEDSELTPSMQEAAYKYGAEAAKTVAKGTNTEYNNTYTEADNGRKVHLRDGGERIDGKNTGKQVRVVEEGTGRNQSEQTKGKPRDSEAASLTLGKEVSTASFYIQNGSRTDKIYRIAGGETTAMKNARAKASERGLNVVFFAGGNLTVDGKPARGYISGKNVLIRADDPNFTADQIMEHEIGHDKIAKGEIDLDTVKDRLNSIYGAETVDFICQQYVEAYEGSNLAPEKVFEEMVCDSLGNMNAFDSESEISGAADGFLATTKAVTEASARAATNPDALVEGKASYSDLLFYANNNPANIVQLSNLPNTIIRQFENFQTKYSYDVEQNPEIAENLYEIFCYGPNNYLFYYETETNYQNIRGVRIDDDVMYELNNKKAAEKRRKIRNEIDTATTENGSRNSGLYQNAGSRSISSSRTVDGTGARNTPNDARSARQNVGSSASGSGVEGVRQDNEGGDGETESVQELLEKLRESLNNPTIGNTTPQDAEYQEMLQKLREVLGEDGKGHSSHVLPSDRTSKPLTAEQKEIWQRVQKMTPMQIANMQLEDIDPLPKHKPSPPSGINAENGKESKFFGSAMDSENVAEDTKQLIKTVDDIRYYAGVSNEETLNEANDRLNLKGLTENNRFFALKPNNATAVDVAEGFILLKRYQDKGDFETACEVARKLREIGTSAGQTVQTFSILGRLTPESMAVYAQKELDEIRNEMIKKHSEAWVEQRKDMFNLTSDEMQFIKDNMIAASKLPNGRDKNILIAQIASMLEEKLPTSVLRMVKGYTRNCMLLNSKTMFRNVLGNAVMLPMYTVEDFAGALLDKSLAKKSGVRTKGATFVNGAALTAAGKGLFESYDDFRHHVNTRQMDGDRFEIGQGNDFHRYTIEERKAASPVKRAAMKLSNALNAVDRFTGFLLDVGDRPFFEAHFIQSLNNQMRLNGVSEPTESMIHIANAEALQRTWQDDNRFTKFVQTIRNGLNFNKDFGLGSIVIAFTKTPANLTKALLEYSPAGLVKAITYNAYKYNQSVKYGVADPKLQKAFVDAFGKGVAGTLATAIGMLLAYFDKISGGDDDEDKDVANFERNIMGIAPYSVTVNGISFSYDWAQPVGGIFAISADLVEGNE